MQDSATSETALRRAGSGDQSVAEDFAAFAVGLGEVDIPPATRHSATRCILDWYACTIAGGVLAPATLLQAAVARSDAGEARLLPGGRLTDQRTAALINGAASHTVEVDDIYSPGLYHPGSPVVSAAIAVGEANGSSGDDLLRAVIAGYEVSNRIARAVNPAHYRYWHTTATVGHFGAAVAAGLLLKLDTRQLAHALTTVATFAAGLRQAFASDAMGKAFHVGRAAEAGVLGALAAQQGVTGVPDMLEGERGFGVAMSEDVDWAAALSGLGQSFTIDATTQKAHACCGHTFAAIDATQHIIRQNELAPAAIAAVRVGTYRAGVEICGNADPKTPYEAKFSLPYTVALAALGRHTGPASFSDTALHDVELRAMMSRVSYELDQRCEDVFPAKRSAYVEIETVDGERLTYHQPSRRGDPAEPLTDAMLSDKFDGLVAPVIGAERCRALAGKLVVTRDDRHCPRAAPGLR